MARTLYPHHRHINFDRALYTALNQTAQWRGCSLAALVRESVLKAVRYEYAMRGVAFPGDYVEPLAGQVELFQPTGPVGDAGPTWAEVGASYGPPSQGILDPEAADAVRSFAALERTGYRPGPALVRALGMGETADE
jgi:hypothetical protein